MTKPSLCVFLAVFIVCNAEQGYVQTSHTQQPTTLNTATLNPSTEFTLITPDHRHKVVFLLEKDSEGTKTSWVILLYSL